jgi:hypothetical protein
MSDVIPCVSLDSRDGVSVGPEVRLKNLCDFYPR